MAKTKVKFCKDCGCYSNHQYRGKPEKSNFDRKFDIIATLATLGGYAVAKKLFDERPKLWECRKCGHISTN